MFRKTSIIIVLLTLVASSLACTISTREINLGNQTIKGSGTLQSESRTVAGIQSVSLSGIGDLTIEVGTQEKLVIEAEDNIISHLTSEVKDGQLNLATEKGINILPTKPIHYTLTITQPLTQLSVSGLGNINVQQLASNSLKFNISGSGNIVIDTITTDSLTVEISGLGSLEIKNGKATSQKIEISGSGSYTAPDLESETANVEISGLGSTKLWVTQQIDAKISGSGNIEYFGNPRVQQEVSGLGKIQSNGEHQ